jgi:hypothetical protein
MKRLPTYVWVCEGCGMWRDWGSDTVFNTQEPYLVCPECKKVTKHSQFDGDGNKSRDQG